jgi:hypothetical protein
MKPDFTVMTKADLRAYVLSHREDQDAFQALADRNPNPQWYQPEDADKITAEMIATKPQNITE